MSAVERVEVLVEPALYELRSLESASRYYVDTRLGISPRYLRIAGSDSMRMRLDSGWRPLTLLACMRCCWDGERCIQAGEVDVHTAQQWVIQVGSEHVFTTPEPIPGRPGPYWVKSSPCREIAVIDDLPPAVLDILPPSQHDNPR